MERNRGEMMVLYRAAIRPLVSYASPLQGDTLFGAFSWSYRYCYGEESLENLLEEIREGKEQVIFSNGFPGGTLPLPLGIRDTEADFETIQGKEARKKAYQEHKKLKSARYVTREWFRKIQGGDYAGFSAGLRDEEAKEASVVHNMVSRQEGTVRNIDGSGSLYEEDEFFVKKDCVYDIYILSSLPEDRLRKVVDMMFLLGIGKNKSVGKGAFEVKEWHEETELRKCDKSNGFVALSNFIPDQSDPVEGRYKTLVKYGKLDREYAMSENPYKKPLIFIQAGAIFKDEKVKMHYGRCVSKVSTMDNVVTNAQTIAIPMWIEL